MESCTFILCRERETHPGILFLAPFVDVPAAMLPPAEPRTTMPMVS